MKHEDVSLDLSPSGWVGLGGVVAGVVAGIMPVGCDGLPRVVSRWSGRSRGQGEDGLAQGGLPWLRLRW